ncbi:putative UspA domain protein [metagenome]|uniref:Putative UspA domain protein n=1 Tax=metagenome TaxID=256318 RepID=A0A2P2C5J3_9ZZZZ
MTTTTPLLVAVDGSSAASAAIRYAAQEAKRLETGLQLVHVVPNYLPISPMMPLSPSDLDAPAMKILRRAAKQARTLLGSEKVTATLLHGPRVATLVDLADDVPLVVIGSQQRPAFERLVTGSTLVGLASRAKSPVVGVPDHWMPGEPHHRIVVGIRSAAEAPDLVRRALETGEALGASVVLLHAWELPSEYDDLLVTHGDREEWNARAHRDIDSVLAVVQAAHPDVQVEVRVVHGQPARVLQVASRDADLLLLSRRRRAFPVGHLGGTGRALLHHAACPVEIVAPVAEPLETPQPGSRAGREPVEVN